MPLADRLVLFLASFAANWFSALSGGGAGLIQFPILIFLGLPFGVALATHKVATVFLGLGAAMRHLRECHLERRLSLAVVAAGVPGVAEQPVGLSARDALGVRADGCKARRAANGCSIRKRRNVADAAQTPNPKGRGRLL